MKIHQLERRQILPIPADVAWAFYANPNNLPQAYPAKMKVSFEYPLPTEVYPGLLIIVNARIMSGLLPVQMVQEVTHSEKPHYFVDEQRLGPFAFFHHQHHFNPIGKDKTEVIDLVHYALPIGYAGELAHGLFVRPQLNHMFDLKEKAVLDFFGEN